MRAIFLWTCLVIAASAAGLAQAPQPLELPDAATGTREEESGGGAEPAAADAEATAEGDGEPVVDPCLATYLEDATWVDWVHKRVFRTACESALWFDNLFGDERIYQERNVTQGRMRLGVAWDERDGVEPITRFRVKYRLPQFERRLAAIVGRDDEERVISDSGSLGERVPTFFGDPEEDEWLLGLGYSPTGGSKSRLSLGAGIRVRVPPEPYVNVGYRYHKFLSETRLVRWRQTAFWESEDGLGTTTRFDVEKVLGPRRLVRWRSVGTISEASQGVEWRTSVILFHKVGDQRGLAYQVGGAGERDGPVTIRDVGFRLIYRQPVFREWLFLDLRPALAWRKEQPEEERKPIWGLGVAVEMRFGQ